MLRYRDFFPLAADTDANAGTGHGIPLVDALPLGILVTDREGKCLYSNTAYQKLCGWTGDELVGSHWSAVIHPEDHEQTVRHWDDAVQGQKPFMCEARLQRSDGEVIWIRRNAALLTDNMPGVGYVHTVEDISTYKADEKAREATTRMEFLAQHDGLTGLWNRNAFYQRFEHSQALARRHEKQMGLLFIDLDNFKGINDLLGHATGDRILVELARQLKTGVRATDTVCRYGGDEFVVLLGEILQPDHGIESEACRPSQ